jgi:PKHD-type hydroxylase
MNLHNQYYWFKDAISYEVCDKIIKMGNERISELKNLGDDVSGTTRGNAQKPEGSNLPSVEELTPKEAQEKLKEYYVRDSQVAWFNDQWLYDLIWPYLETANHEAGWDWDIDWAESFQFTKYDKNGLYGWHNDGGSDHNGKYILADKCLIEKHKKEGTKLPNIYTDDEAFAGKVRKISMTLNLSNPEDFEGGKLKFDLGKTHDTGVDIWECEELKTKGSMIFFPSFLPHTVTPITKGTRYSLVLWALGKPWR